MVGRRTDTAMIVVIGLLSLGACRSLLKIPGQEIYAAGCALMAIFGFAVAFYIWDGFDRLAALLRRSKKS